jgi:hypothetical protein
MERITKMRDDMDRWRTQICNISYMTTKKMVNLQAREDRLLETMQHQDIAEGKRKVINRYMLDAMQIESKRWPKLNDLDNTITTKFILPQTVLNFTEYQEKLQRIAFYAEQGDNEAMQKLLDKEDVMEKKNSFMQPIYRDIKTTIKHMTNTPEYKILREYERNRQLILAALPAESAKAKDGFAELKQSYAKLLCNHRLKMKSDPSFGLSVIQQRIDDIFKLLSLWSEYISIIYAPESEINMLKNMKDSG